MDPIQWNATFAVGIGEIDEQHRRLVDMINALQTARDPDGSETTGRLLLELSDYVRDHFSLEERLMDMGDFEAEFVTRHRGEHAYFRGVLKNFSDDFESGRRQLNSSLIEYLVNWLLQHILVTDREMAQQHNATTATIAAKMLEQAMNPNDDPGASQRDLIKQLLRANAELTRQIKELRQANPGDVTNGDRPPPAASQPQ